MTSPSDTRILLDVMCGGLTSVLRMVGYDTAYALDRDAEDDEVLIEVAEAENRLIVTRDRAVARAYEPSVLLEAKDPDEQLCELASAGFVLRLDEPERCSNCNGPLESVESGEMPSYVPDPDEQPIWQCRKCEQYYWIGSHWTDVESRLEAIEE